MRVCMVAYSFYESDTRILQYASALAARGDSVDVLSLRREGDPAFEVIDGVHVYRIQARTVDEKSRFDYLFRILRFLFVSAIALTRKHFAKPYQIIHVHSVPDFLVFSAIVPKLQGAHVILDIHDILPELYASKFGVASDSLLFKSLALIEKLSIRFSDHVIIANHLWYERLISRSVSPNKCTVILNYPDPRVFSPRRKRARDGKFVILYPGSLNYLQGLDIAIRAFARIARQIPAAEFHIYGEGPEKPSLLRLTKELGLSGRVLFCGFRPTAEIAEVMAHSDLGVVPKRASSPFANEAASTKIMEFMSVRVPLIVSRTKIDTFYHDDSMVRFFESENEADLANAILLLWGDPELRERLVAGANGYVEQNTWHIKKQEYLNLVDQLNTPAAIAHRVVNRC